MKNSQINRVVICMMLLAVTLASTPSYGAVACFTQGYQSVSSNNYQMMAISSQPQAFQCSTKKLIGAGLDGFSWSLQAGAVYSLCTGVGAPVSVYLTGTSLITSFIQMIVAQVECVDDEKEIQRETSLIICKTLNQNLNTNAKKLDCSAFEGK